MELLQTVFNVDEIRSLKIPSPFEGCPEYWLYSVYRAWVYGIVYKHWPDTREFVTRTVELWNRWIRLSCYYNRV